MSNVCLAKIAPACTDTTAAITKSIGDPRRSLTLTGYADSLAASTCGPGTPAADRAALHSERIARCTPQCLFEAHLAMTRTVIVPPVTDSTPSTLGSSKTIPFQASRSCIPATVSAMISVTWCGSALYPAGTSTLRGSGSRAG